MYILGAVLFLLHSVFLIVNFIWKKIMQKGHIFLCDI